MNNDAAASESKPIELRSLEEKVEQYQPWDDREWKQDWNKVYRQIVSFTAGGAVLGAGHALSTGRSILPNSMAFAGYATIVSGIYYAAREALFGREIERFRREALALGLPESQARDYPWRWDVLCGGLSGGFFGGLVGQSRRMVVAGAALFGAGALGLRVGSSAFSDYALPRMLSSEQIEFERASKLKVLTKEELKRIDAEDEAKRRKEKPWLMKQLPDWSPIQAYSPEEREQQLKDKEYEDWLKKEVEETRVSVAIKRQLRNMEIERLRQENPELAASLKQIPTTAQPPLSVVENKS